MLKKTGWLSAGLTLAAFSAVASFALGSAGSAQAAVAYCKTAGVPQGCVVRPTAPVAAAAVVAPVAPVARVGVAPVGVRHVGYTRVTPHGVRHVGYTRVRR